MVYEKNLFQWVFWLTILAFLRICSAFLFLLSFSEKGYGLDMNKNCVGKNPVLLFLSVVLVTGCTTTLFNPKKQFVWNEPTKGLRIIADYDPSLFPSNTVCGRVTVMNYGVNDYSIVNLMMSFSDSEWNLSRKRLLATDLFTITNGLSAGATKIIHPDVNNPLDKVGGIPGNNTFTACPITMNQGRVEINTKIVPQPAALVVPPTKPSASTEADTPDRRNSDQERLGLQRIEKAEPVPDLEKISSPSSNDTGLKLQAMQAVRSHLRDYGNAKFIMSSLKSAKVGDKYYVIGEFDSKNAFGAKVRSTFAVEFIKSSESRYEATYVEIK